MAKPKKGVEPPALKAYRLAKKRRKNPVRDPAHKRLVKSLASHFSSDEKNAKRRTRRKNPAPRDLFRLAIKKGGQTLYLKTSGEKFAKVGPFKRYATPQGVLGAAQAIAEKYANSLRGWKMYSVT